MAKKNIGVGDVVVERMIGVDIGAGVAAAVFVDRNADGTYTIVDTIIVSPSQQTPRLNSPVAVLEAADGP